ncbi:hypothetical protein [Desulfuromonas acetoxidans]|nr:hypothetical protein [Desulfuromonas acetoxidans]MBF0644749.1 hypothetical protein [Desulfuromonas acetoxidans]NVD25251.1 hypothetical protein [Desulfuromonas acetoxidans]NVE17345.1 hypothetical protein [Desulfuromonas acetoxidans]
MEELNDWKFFWPKTDSLPKATTAARQGFIAAIFIACVSPPYMLPTLLSAGLQQHFYIIFIPTLFYGVLAVFVYKMSRVAALVGFLVFLPRFVIHLLEPGFTSIVWVALALAFINSIRGTFAYHKHARQPQESITTAEKTLSVAVPPTCDSTTTE